MGVKVGGWLQHTSSSYMYSEKHITDLFFYSRRDSDTIFQQQPMSKIITLPSCILCNTGKTLCKLIYLSCQCCSNPAVGLSLITSRSCAVGNMNRAYRLPGSSVTRHFCRGSSLWTFRRLRYFSFPAHALQESFAISLDHQWPVGLTVTRCSPLPLVLSMKHWKISQRMYLWCSLYILYLLACQVELPWAIQVFVVVSLVCRALLFPFVWCLKNINYLGRQ